MFCTSFGKFLGRRCVRFVAKMGGGGQGSSRLLQNFCLKHLWRFEILYSILCNKFGLFIVALL